MKRLVAVLVLAGASVNAQTITQTFGSGANAFSIDFVTIGNPGNAADTTGYPNPSGSVSYIYKLAKYEISRDMINKANAVGSLGISLQDISGWGVTSENWPGSGITWYGAAKFVNWMNTSSGHSAAYKFDSNGNLQLWNSSDSGYNSNNFLRNSNARYVIPSLDEWYKAAYGSPSGDWYDYPTGNNEAPSPVIGGTADNTAVYSGQFRPADINNAGGLSAWGTMAQGGNVWEWTETAFDGVNDVPDELRAIRGGPWHYGGSYFLSSSYDLGYNGPDGGTVDMGFRVAMVPEPSSLSLLVAGGAVFAAARRRKLD